MAQLNRLIAPSHKAFSGLNLPQLQLFQLQNGLPVHYLNTQETGVLKLDFVFNAGLRNQTNPGIASAVSAMLTEGTSKYTAKQIAESLDQYGAYLQTRATADDAIITLYCLAKHLSSCLPFVIQILTDCSFPENEIDTYKKQSIQRFLINSQRNSFLGRRAFYASIFGKENGYGCPVNQEDYDSISRETLLAFYHDNYLNKCKYLLIAGSVDDVTLHELNTTIGQLNRIDSTPKPISISTSAPQVIQLTNPHSVQSSIRVGRPMINRKDANYNKLQLLNLALGGFFGSRLMKNIREDKGLTYGIYSALESYWNAGAFYIEVEVNHPKREIALAEISKELSILCTEAINEDELRLVKNYMLGSFLRGLDGPFALVDRHKMILDYGFTYQYYQNFVEDIKSATASELQHLATQYFAPEGLTTVVVGNKNNE